MKGIRVGWVSRRLGWARERSLTVLSKVLKAVRVVHQAGIGCKAQSRFNFQFRSPLEIRTSQPDLHTKVNPFESLSNPRSFDTLVVVRAEERAKARSFCDKSTLDGYDYVGDRL